MEVLLRQLRLFSMYDAYCICLFADWGIVSRHVGESDQYWEAKELLGALDTSFVSLASDEHSRFKTV